MIVLPVLLKQVLPRIEGTERRTIALDFARHALDMCHDAFDEAHREVVASYLGAATATLSDSANFDALVEARSEFFRSREGNVNTSSHRVGWVVNLAVDLCFLTDLRREKVVTDHSSWVPSLVDVAEEAQSVVAQHVLREYDSDDLAGLGQARQAARWEEARSQLIRVIEVVPVPKRS